MEGDDPDSIEARDRGHRPRGARGAPEATDADAGAANRRAFLALCAGGLGALAGCPGEIGIDSETTSAATPTRRPTASPATTRPSPPSATTAFEGLYRRTIDSVTLVETTSGSGSGWVVDERGRIVTNEHVVGGDARVDVRYSRDEWRSAEVLGTDPIGDLAVVEPSNPPGYAAPLPLSVESPPVGSDVAILGAPFGLPGSLSVGVVSATNRLLESPTGSAIPGAIQVDATANPGNSGGPILSLDGAVVGVVNSGAGIAVNFGIPGRLADAVVPVLIETGTYRYPTLGLSLLEVDPDVARANGLDAVTGVLVVDVVPGGPAAGRLRGSSGVEWIDGRRIPVGGDVVVGLDGRTITADEDYAAYLTFSTRPGDRVDVTVLRDGSRRTVELGVGGRATVG
jgi:S1-C subfamily serine protease